MKRCNICTLTKLHEHFYPRKDAKDGYVNKCKACFKLYEQANVAHISKIKKLYYQKNKEQKKLEVSQYRKENPGKVNALNRKHQNLKKQRAPKWLTKEHLEEIKEFYILAKELQWLSDPTDPLQVDHIVPLNGKNVSGLHVPWNLQILPKSLNIKKFNHLGNV